MIPITKLICVNIQNVKTGLTLYKVYDGYDLDETTNTVFLINDNNMETVCYLDRFTPLEEHRRQRLNKILHNNE